MENEEKVELKREDVVRAELPKLDVTKYVGKEVEIQTVEVMKGHYGHYLKFSSTEVDVLADVMDKDGNPLILRATKTLGLHEKEGKIVIGIGSKLDQFLQKYGVEHFDDMVGKKVKVQTQLNKNDGRDYLTFN